MIDHIEKESEHQPVQLMCRVLKMPKSTYYQSFHKQPNSYHVANEKLLARIREIHADSDGRYGAPKIFALLKQEGYTGSIDRIQRIMKHAGIRSNIVKKYKPASSSAPVEERENVLNQDFTTEAINENGWAILRISIPFKMAGVIWHRYKIYTQKRLSAISSVAVWRWTLF